MEKKTNHNRDNFGCEITHEAGINNNGRFYVCINYLPCEHPAAFLLRDENNQENKRKSLLDKQTMFYMIQYALPKEV